MVEGTRSKANREEIFLGNEKPATVNVNGKSKSPRVELCPAHSNSLRAREDLLQMGFNKEVIEERDSGEQINGLMTAGTMSNGKDVEDDVWDAIVGRLGLINDEHVWSYVEPEVNQPERNYPAYEPPAHMYEVD
ncbi:hypothetical protein V6N13_148367 [Hibiscus sabdariffa]|uniref:Uncharacterized protein n=1 Tax=Hibiscus sabdariffa TaxID=183260 RepID=A0ABR2TYD1_9ROSI